MRCHDGFPARLYGVSLFWTLTANLHDNAGYHVAVRGLDRRRGSMAQRYAPKERTWKEKTQ